MSWSLKVYRDSEHRATIGFFESSVKDGPGLFQGLHFRTLKYLNPEELDRIEELGRKILEG